MTYTLAALRNEVLSHGFDPVNFGSARVNQYLNDIQALVCRRVDYYVDEATQDFPTVAGTTTYSLPADFARVRSVRDTGRNIEMLNVGLRTIDRSINTSGAPLYYALNEANLQLYPSPDNVYPLEIRYWKTPADLVNDTDVPTLPAAYHRMLWMGAVAECYYAEEDVQNAPAWQQRFENMLAQFAADVKFPNDDMSNQLADFWVGGPALQSQGWSILGSDLEG